MNGPTKENGVWRIPVRIVKKEEEEAPQLETSSQAESLYGTSIKDDQEDEVEEVEPTLPPPPAKSPDKMERLTKALAQAQYQNEQLSKDLERLRTRTNETVKQRLWQAKQGMIKSWLAVSDTVDRAIFSVENDGDDSTHADGWRGLREQINALLVASGVEEIQAKGEPFDPTIHEAVGTLPIPDQPADTVYEVVERGFMLEGALLRPAKVITVRGA